MKEGEYVIKILELLEYPYTLSKNIMLNVGAPNTWPHLLGVLHWFVLLIDEQDILNEIIKDQVEESEIFTDDFRINYEVDAYKAWYCSKDKEFEENNLYRNKIHESVQEIKSQNDNLLMNINNINTQINQLNENKSKPAILDEEINNTEIEIVNLTNLTNNLDNVIQETDQNIKQLTDENSRIELDNNNLEGEILELKSIINNQP